LSVESDAQWDGLLRAIGRPAVLDRRAWATNAGRLANQPELDAALAPILAGRSSRAWAQLLAREGVPAARLQHDDDAVLRRDLWEADILRPLTRRDRPALEGGGPPWRFEPPLEVLEAPNPGDDPPAWDRPLAPLRASSIQSSPE
jgi:crotonobetainyl-CoA:carnitine CoA-transferase CaiB-like acyl-CoA transferase